ncbi:MULTISPECIES: fimbrial protein [Pantoea]|uniref:fimbrial protein n=1 Tax=Pantoea TaxID=53335 RepID=UPI001F353E67|nr:MULTISPECIES: fimbrial protein [Pantoea]UIL51495.1 fimbrial protein [Pantoea agglomerans]
MKYKVNFLFAVSFILWSLSAAANTYWNTGMGAQMGTSISPSNKACAGTGINTFSYYKLCVPYKDAPWGYDVGQEFNAAYENDGKYMSFVLWGTFYVPYTGTYRSRLHLCAGSWGVACTISKSYTFYDSVASVRLEQNKTIESQQPYFGSFVGAKLQTKSMVCYTLVDDAGNEWSTHQWDGAVCADAHLLPSQPATCYLNYHTDLDVELGMLERSKIATVPASGTSGNIKKTFPVLCTRDAGVTVKTTFQFTSLTVNGNEVVSTSTPNLGVAIFYNGKLVGPASTPIIETFENGYTDRELEFQAVRNPVVEAKNIPTGAFTASAVMVMTEQ